MRHVGPSQSRSRRRLVKTTPRPALAARVASSRARLSRQRPPRWPAPLTPIGLLSRFALAQADLHLRRASRSDASCHRSPLCVGSRPSSSDLLVGRLAVPRPRQAIEAPCLLRTITVTASPSPASPHLTLPPHYRIAGVARLLDPRRAIAPFLIPLSPTTAPGDVANAANAPNRNASPALSAIARREQTISALDPSPMRPRAESGLRHRPRRHLIRRHLNPPQRPSKKRTPPDARHPVASPSPTVVAFGAGALLRAAPPPSIAATPMLPPLQTASASPIRRGADLAVFAISAP